MKKNEKVIEDTSDKLIVFIKELIDEKKRIRVKTWYY